MLPGMIEAADFFEPYNLSYHKNPKVNIVQDDGRHFLARTDKKYDLISVNITDAHLPGQASFYHADFYQLAKKHLNPDGKLVQLIHGLGVKIMINTIRESFDYVLLLPVWKSTPVYNADDYQLLVLASNSPLNLNRQSVLNLNSNPRVKTALSLININEMDELETVLSSIRRLEDYPDLMSETKIATDNYPRTEFSWYQNPIHQLIKAW